MSVERVTVIIVTYNSAHCIDAQVEVLRHLPHVVVVDNGSEDDTIARCQKLLPHARIDAVGQNLGFGAANNRALAQVATPYALLLNPDCVITLAAIAELIALAQSQSNAAICVPQIIGAAGKSTLNYGWVKHYWQSRGAAAEGLCCVGYASGAVMLLNIAVTRSHGYFDERFFLYYEDDDICLKYFNARLPIILSPQIQARHVSRSSVKSKNVVRQEYWRGYHHAQSKLLITEKYQSADAMRHLRRVKISTGILLVLLRTLTLNPRLGARMAGRVVGLTQYKTKLAI